MKKITLFILALICLTCFCNNFVFGEKVKVLSEEEVAKLQKANAKPVNPQRSPSYEILGKWESLTFKSISDTNELFDCIRKAPLKGDAEAITPEQHEKLSQSLYLMCRAFSDGTAEAYYDFRTPKGPAWHFTPYELSQVLSQAKTMAKPLDFESLKLFLYNESSSNGIAYRNFWKGVCFDTDEIYKNTGKEQFSYVPKYGITIRKTEQFTCFESDYIEPELILSQIKGRKIKDYTRITEEDASKKLVYYAVGPILAFEETPNKRETFRENAGLIYADVHFFVKRNAKIPCPVFVRFYWSPKFEIWIPEGMGVGGIYGTESAVRTRELF